MVLELREHARTIVEKKAREKAGNVLMCMKERFSTVLSLDKDSMPRIWTGNEDIRAITREARLALYDWMTIESTSDPLASSTWEEVSPKDTLITPMQCKSIWRQFKAETQYAVVQAMSVQEAHRRNYNWLPPAWTILLLAILGFNEFMFLLRNPLYILGLFLAFVLSYAAWLQYDIAAYFRHATLHALLTVLSSLLPTIMDIITSIVSMRRSEKHSSRPARRPPPLHAQSFRNQTRRQAQVRYQAPHSPSASSVDSNSGDES